ncbi:MAG: FAD-binding oxidoreductase [Chitinophagaceae bacterium]|nr:FAD-binding oxidoreductase [Chitinophagaceae bacterium]
MQTEVIVVGQGICGTWLSYYLLRQQKSFVVIDDALPNSPSRIAAGIINPVTGRRYAEVWLARELIPFVRNAYEEIGQFLNIRTYAETLILDFFPAQDMRMRFEKRMKEQLPFVRRFSSALTPEDFFLAPYGYGEIAPAFVVQLQNLLPAWKQFLQSQKLLREERFLPARLNMTQRGVTYGDLKADKIIFCNGAGGLQNPFFSYLPFALNKGEALILEISGLPKSFVYKRTFMLAPWQDEHLWWFGANYVWDYADDLPSEEFRKAAEALLNQWLKLPYKILDHVSGIRPATTERRPFAGWHPAFNALGILNGMGTKGCSLAPYFAWQLVENITSGKPLHPEADIGRFSTLWKNKNS